MITAPMWTITEEKVTAAIRQIVRSEQPSKIIIFGSTARGTGNVDSDLDLLVVTEDERESPRRASVRIRHALRDIPMPMDILVISEKRLAELANRPGLVYREALDHGRLVYER